MVQPSLPLLLPRLCLSSRKLTQGETIVAGSRRGSLDPCWWQDLSHPQPVSCPQSTPALSHRIRPCSWFQSPLASALSSFPCLPLASRRYCSSDSTLGCGGLCWARTLCLWSPTLWCRGMPLLVPCHLGLGRLGWVTTNWTSGVASLFWRLIPPKSLPEVQTLDYWLFLHAGLFQTSSGVLETSPFLGAKLSPLSETFSSFPPISPQPRTPKPGSWSLFFCCCCWFLSGPWSLRLRSKNLAS